MICTKRHAKEDASPAHVFPTLQRFNATQITSVLYVVLVINLFIALCLPSSFAQWPLFRADTSYIRHTQSLQSQLYSLANGHALLLFPCCLEAESYLDTGTGRPQIWKVWNPHYVSQWKSKALKCLNKILQQNTL